MCFRGISDKHSWINNYYKPDRPLLWDEEYQPKPALAAVRTALLEGTKGYFNLPNESDWGKKWLVRVSQAGQSKSEEDQPEVGVAIDEPSWGTAD